MDGCLRFVCFVFLQGKHEICDVAIAFLVLELPLVFAIWALRGSADALMLNSQSMKKS